MARHAVTKQLPAEPAAVWHLVSDMSNIEWMPPTQRVEVEGDGPGHRRWIYGSTDVPTVERWLEVDEGRRHFVYEILENNPLPVSSYVVTVDVRAGDAGGTSITWDVEYETTDEPRVIAGIDAVYGMIAGWLDDATSSTT